MNQKIYSKKISSGLASITSGILTTLLYDIFSSSSAYELTKESDVLWKITSTVNSHPMEKSLFIIFLFIVFWLLLEKGLPFITDRIISFTTKEKTVFTNQYISKHYKITKDRIINIIGVMSSDSELNNCLLEDLFECIHNLQVLFDTSSKAKKASVENVFRHDNQFFLANKYISKFDYISLLDLLNTNLEKANISKCSTDLQGFIEKDLTNAKEIINDLRAVIQ